ncbi:hypothetical protein D3C80_1907360 [compost metagenome]
MNFRSGGEVRVEHRRDANRQSRRDSCQACLLLGSSLDSAVDCGFQRSHSQLFGSALLLVFAALLLQTQLQVEHLVAALQGIGGGI